jgi:hypothetical protein
LRIFKIRSLLRFGVCGEQPLLETPDFWISVQCLLDRFPEKQRRWRFGRRASGGKLKNKNQRK